ncbi:MAG: FAD-binding oxidoreductase [Synechococcaceae cyanobacterium RM1_1_27]|nr:FAD-binding oxidoreductase [Synechococcaceae cyanobacterium RM1_1_27]
MKDSFDWIVVGAGITGAALAYELSCQGHAVLLIEKDSPFAGCHPL